MTDYELAERNIIRASNRLMVMMYKEKDLERKIELEDLLRTLCDVPANKTFCQVDKLMSVIVENATDMLEESFINN